MNKKELGSKTAKGGFNNEKSIWKKFNLWQIDKDAQTWLKIMGYDIKKIKSVSAIQIPTRIKKSEIEKFGVTQEEYEEIVKFKKADAQIKIIIKLNNVLRIENLSLKKANSDSDFNQVDKRSIDEYQKMWKFDDEISFWLKLFTGELLPSKYKDKLKINTFRDNRRLFIDEMPQKIQTKIMVLLI